MRSSLVIAGAVALAACAERPLGQAVAQAPPSLVHAFPTLPKPRLPQPRAPRPPKSTKAGVRFRLQEITGSPAPRAPVERTTMLLRSGLHSPMPGGYIAGYPEDTGLDIGGFRLPVYAIAAGTLDYSEPGHTRWPGHDDKAVRLELDVPIPYKGRLITHVFYAHLHELAYLQREGATHRRRVVAGERLGISGIANGSPHLHLGFLLDDDVRQRWGTYLLDHEIRDVLGHYRQKERLPPEPPRRRKADG